MPWKHYVLVLPLTQHLVAFEHTSFRFLPLCTHITQSSPDKLGNLWNIGGIIETLNMGELSVLQSLELSQHTWNHYFMSQVNGLPKWLWGLVNWPKIWSQTSGDMKSDLSSSSSVILSTCYVSWASLSSSLKCHVVWEIEEWDGEIPAWSLVMGLYLSLTAVCPAFPWGRCVYFLREWRVQRPHRIRAGGGSAVWQGTGREDETSCKAWVRRYLWGKVWTTIWSGAAQAASIKSAFVQGEG